MTIHQMLVVVVCLLILHFLLEQKIFSLTLRHQHTNDIDLLKIGRHFRFDEKTKFIVGRHKDENEMLKALALPGDVLFDAKDHVGPISLLRGEDSEKNLKLAAAIAVRYSDAPKDKQV